MHCLARNRTEGERRKHSCNYFSSSPPPRCIGRAKKFTTNRNLESVAKLYSRYAFITVYSTVYIPRMYIERERERKREKSYENIAYRALVSFPFKFHYCHCYYPLLLVISLLSLLDRNCYVSPENKVKRYRVCTIGHSYLTIHWHLFKM